MYRTTHLDPFGLVLHSIEPGRPAGDIPVAELVDLVARHKAVVLRGFAPLGHDDFIAHAHRFGPLLQWEFGELLNLRIEPKPANHLFTGGRVEMHWDGAYLTEVPRFSLFQCLDSNGREEGGQTLFTDTERMLELAGDELRAVWERVSISYSTRKAAHYGGAVTVPLVGRHRDSGKPTVRFIEPFNEDNLDVHPVEVKVIGLADEEQEPFLRQVIEHVYDPRCMYKHQWQAGDFLIYDNHALLHGRARVRGNVQRHLQRIHVLDGEPHSPSRAPQFLGAETADVHV